VAYELVINPVNEGNGMELGLGMALGAFAFFFGDLWIDRSGGDDRKKMAREEGEGNALALFLGVRADEVALKPL